MKNFALLILLLLAVAVKPALAAEVAANADDAKVCRPGGEKMDCEAGAFGRKSEGGFCRTEMRGRCGKRRGDWYGASKPVVSAVEAQALLQNYFAGHDYTVSAISERRWGYRAEIIDKDGKVVDRVMIDKRSGRIRSLY